MRIALASKKFVNNNTEKNLETMIETMHEAKDQGAEVVMFGEAFLQGFDALKWNYDLDKFIALNTYSEPINRLCKESRKLNLDVIFGYIEKDRDLISSSYLIIERGEPIYNYKRLTKGWKERCVDSNKHYYEGHVVEVFEYRHKRCMIALCGDLWELPELYLRNEEILFWPIYTDFSVKDWEHKYIQEYKEHTAQFEHTSVLMVNSLCEPTGVGGAFYFKDGKIIDSIKPGEEGLIIASVDE